MQHTASQVFNLTWLQYHNTLTGAEANLSNATFCNADAVWYEQSFHGILNIGSIQVCCVELT